jgi:hypothetical protein
MNPTGEDILKLWCLVEGHRGPTRISINCSDIVDDLRTTIKLKEDIPGPTSNIIIWKVRSFYKIIDTLINDYYAFEGGFHQKHSA